MVNAFNEHLRLKTLSMQLMMHDCLVVCCRSWDTAF